MARRAQDFSPKVVLLLRDQVNGICSNPSCCNITVGPSDLYEGREIVGKACHIKAASVNGPRYDQKQSEEDRTSINNGIWLCSICADKIDKNNGIDYPLKTLYSWKAHSLKKARNSIGKQEGSEKIWGRQFSALTYVNIPRLSIMASQAGFDLDCPVDIEGDKPLFLYGYEINYIMSYFSKLIESLSIPALPLRHLLAAKEIDSVGAIVSFKEVFRTKNGPDIPMKGQKTLAINADWEKSPHVYFKSNNKKIVMVYDPCWVTTSTAHCELKDGTTTLVGIGLVKKITRDLMFVSPLVLGLPKPLFDLDAIMSDQRRITIEEEL
jgi:hypothetical protein